MFVDNSLAAQAAYSSVLSAARMAQLNRSPADLPGGFASKLIHGKRYHYYQRRGPAGLEQIYVGPDDEATRTLIEAAHNETASANQLHLRKLSNAAAALGCYTVAPKHFRVLKRLADHGVFSAGALVVGTHAFLAYQNVLGVIWGDPGQTVDLDSALPRSMPTPFAIYSAESLPHGFVYPELFRTFGATGIYPAIQPWWFVDAESKAGRLMFSVRRHDGRNLIPFAKVDDGRGDVACFDGDDSTGNPQVLMLVLDESGRSYSFADFEAWLAAAEADALAWTSS